MKSEAAQANGPPFFLSEKCFDEFFGVEFGDIFWCFAQADEFYGYVESVLYRDNYSASGGAVEFCEEYTSYVDSLCEEFGLYYRVLASGGIENEQDLVRRGGYLFGDNVSDFGEFSHEVFLCMESSGGIEY